MLEDLMTWTGAKRRVNNLKLRYARLLASYTPILGILAAAEDGGIRMSRVKGILDATPLERLDDLRRLGGKPAELAASLIQQYDGYLELMSGAEAQLFDRVLQPDWSKGIKAKAYAFGDEVAELMQTIGGRSPLYRYVIV